MSTYRQIYFIGIGGIGMSALARWFRHAGYAVSGYDRTPSRITDALRSEGIDVHFQADTALVPPSPDDTLVIYTPAVPSDMEELAYVRAHGYRLIKRAEALGELTEGKRCLAVSGTHGKTSTSTMLAHILTVSGEGCTAFLGGISKNYDTNLLLSDSNTVVAEADEFDRSFLHLHPETAVITSMDADHLDIYSGIEDLRETFVKFAMQTDRHLIIKKGLEDRFIQARVKARIYTYGKGGDFHAEDIVSDGHGLMYFTLCTPWGRIERIHAGVPGLVYIENATAAAAAALLHGTDAEKIKEAISTFRGVRRRFDIQFDLNGHTYIDDYAHHPAEIAATIASIRRIWPGRKICGIFQPHLYTRTRDFHTEFARSLSALDSVILLPVYPAREKPIPGVGSEMLLGDITLKDKMLVDKDSLVETLAGKDIDILITFGAGDIDRLVEPIHNMLVGRYA
ncbi:MAG TPA: UDP-N-acetylmuramate--L-alanine ligase [Candidatus Coprenecus pullistercoris]|nr:UDP-N-acetylmuramate--L-alanine ligase [Candidatus Coprenecus pullistercoris]